VVKSGGRWWKVVEQVVKSGGTEAAKRLITLPKWWKVVEKGVLPYPPIYVLPLFLFSPLSLCTPHCSIQFKREVPQKKGYQYVKSMGVTTFPPPYHHFISHFGDIATTKTTTEGAAT